MPEEYTLKDALNYRDRIEKVDDYFRLNLIEFDKAIKFFADKGDKTNFKKLTDKVLGLLKNSEQYLSTVAMRENPISFLEFLCAGIDKGFATIGYSGAVNEGIEPGNAQKLVRELYLEEKNNSPVVQ